MLRRLAERLPSPIRIPLKKLLTHRRRRAIAMRYYAAHLETIDRWAWKDSETYNFFYRITPSNRDHLAHLISSLCDEAHSKIVQYFDELEGDERLREHLQRALRSGPFGSEIEVEYGRRLGWYAFTRVLKPTVVVETGVDQGVGACVLASALLRNAAEGCEGRYYGTEIERDGGKLFSGRYAAAGRILYGDSIRSLEKLDETVDLFVNDSDHSGEYEYREYLTIAGKLSDKAFLLGDNSHATDSLSRFSREKNRSFIFFSEKPLDHWYPGAGIGISFPRRARP